MSQFIFWQMLTVDGDEHHALAGSTPRGGECSLGGSGQVQRSLPLHIQGELDDDRDDDVTGAISCRNLTNWIEFSLKKYLFQFGLDSANGQRILPVEMAVSLWQLVFSQVRLLTNPKIVEILVMMTLFQEEPALLKKWLHFLEKHPQVIFDCLSPTLRKF